MYLQIIRKLHSNSVFFPLCVIWASNIVSTLREIILILESNREYTNGLLKIRYTVHVVYNAKLWKKPIKLLLLYVKTGSRIGRDHMAVKFTKSLSV